MSFVEFTEIARNISLTVAAPFGAYVAWSGLNSWKNEKKWTREVELIEELLILYYERRDKVDAIRNPFVSYRPLVIDEEGNPISEPDMQRFLGLATEYRNRVDALDDVRKRGYPLGLRAAIVLGDDVTTKMRAILDLERNLIGTLNRFLSSQNPAEQDFMREAAREGQDFLILYKMDHERDTFSPLYDEAFSGLEQFLRTRLDAAQ